MELFLFNFKDIAIHYLLETRDWRNSENVKQGFVIPHITKEMHSNWVDNIVKSENPTTVAFIIATEKVDIGVAYLQNIDYQAGTADLGIYILKEFQDKKLGTLFIQRLLQYAKDVLKLSKVTADCRADDERTQHILEEKIGFKYLNIAPDEKYNVEKKFYEYETEAADA